MIPENYAKQAEGLKKLKEKYKDLIHPFVFVDPRRLTDGDDSDVLKGGPFLDYIREGMTNGKFAGIKIYPALGYWPFSRGMMEVYDFAVENNIPLLTHCAGGPVYYRGRKMDKQHPIYRQHQAGRMPEQQLYAALFQPAQLSHAHEQDHPAEALGRECPRLQQAENMPRPLRRKR